MLAPGAMSQYYRFASGTKKERRIKYNTIYVYNVYYMCISPLLCSLSSFVVLKSNIYLYNIKRTELDRAKCEVAEDALY